MHRNFEINKYTVEKVKVELLSDFVINSLIFAKNDVKLDDYQVFNHFKLVMCFSKHNVEYFLKKQCIVWKISRIRQIYVKRLRFHV